MKCGYFARVKCCYSSSDSLFDSETAQSIKAFLLAAIVCYIVALLLLETPPVCINCFRISLLSTVARAVSTLQE